MRSPTRGRLSTRPSSGSISQARATGATWRRSEGSVSAVSSALVGIVVGSESDRERMQPALDELEARGIAHEFEVRSAHRDPDAVAEYCRGARERGLRVLIAGAGLAAALPGVAAAHTDLPVIGVPLRSSKSVLDGLDALLSIVQMPPGVPVACVGVDNAKNAVELAALDAWAELGVVPREDAAAIRARATTPTPQRVREIEATTDHDTAAFVDAVAEQLGPEGRWVHYGLTSSDVVDTALSLQLREAGALILSGLDRAFGLVVAR